MGWASTFYWTGAAQVVAGGLVAAATAPLDLAKGSWLAAYLVLVGGVAQCLVGRAQEAFAPAPVRGRTWWVQYAGWNAGNLLVIVGSLTRAPYVVDVGGLLLLPTLVLAVWTTRAATAGVLLWAYRAVLFLLAVTMPIGLALAHLRA
ncbi:hypothetical protein ncot_02480 [Nocardioides sp. JQ2195]|uniref:hypothetical protein n=1 Tax=Nocardioides sp. JQ2195 TaxID=2592334 RepID=UPI00143EB6B8|nr:hypothetical protein [Nocardioides sp. JQ2195]QIX25581.1 hypothetical protein ncot_02480 [Nocardioides sp. JQ2195]